MSYGSARSFYGDLGECTETSDGGYVSVDTAYVANVIWYTKMAVQASVYGNAMEMPWKCDVSAMGLYPLFSNKIISFVLVVTLLSVSFPLQWMDRQPCRTSIQLNHEDVTHTYTYMYKC